MIWLLLYWYNILYSGIFVYKPFSHNKVFQVCLCLAALPSAVILWFFKVSYMLDRTSLRLLISLIVALRVFSASSVIHDFDYFSLQQSFKWYLVKRGCSISNIVSLIMLIVRLMSKGMLRVQASVTDLYLSTISL